MNKLIELVEHLDDLCGYLYEHEEAVATPQELQVLRNLAEKLQAIIDGEQPEQETPA